jgi:hypothetical protein
MESLQKSKEIFWKLLDKMMAGDEQDSAVVNPHYQQNDHVAMEMQDYGTKFVSIAFS